MLSLEFAVSGLSQFMGGGDKKDKKDKEKKKKVPLYNIILADK